MRESLSGVSARVAKNKVSINLECLKGSSANCGVFAGGITDRFAMQKPVCEPFCAQKKPACGLVCGVLIIVMGPITISAKPLETTDTMCSNHRKRILYLLFILGCVFLSLFK